MREDLSDVVVVGGGCSGVLVLANLLRNSKNPIKIHIIEKSSDLGKGIAYNTTCPKHILNVVSQNMSGYADEPNHLLNWLKENDFEATPLQFLPREIYAKYLLSCMEEAKSGGIQNEIIHIQAEVSSVLPSGSFWHVKLNNGNTISTKHVVLASGLFFAENTHCYIKNPWNFDFKSISPKSKIGIIGNGLSMVDIILLLKELDWTGEITVLAKKNQLPIAHNLAYLGKKMPIEWSKFSNLRDIFKEFKQQLKNLESQNCHWINLVDSLRPFSQIIWQNFSEYEKSQFSRHLQSLWDLHRHRVAPNVAEQMQQLERGNFFKIKQAFVKEVEQKGEKITAHCKCQNQESPFLEEFDFLVSCVGIESDYSKVQSVLIKELLSNGVVQRGSLGKGLKANGQGQLIGHDGMIHQTFYTLGFAQIGNLGESIAVPEIRNQALNIAKNIISQLMN